MTLAEPGTRGQGLRGRPFRLLLAASVASFTGQVLLLPLVPLLVVRGGADATGAGATTAVFMFATVASQLAMPWLLARAGGYRWTFWAGSLLIALPTPLLLLTDDLAPVLAVSAVRGLGFGLFSVAGSALAARLVPPEWIGRAAGRYGLAVGLPNLVFLATGVGFSLQFGFAPALWTATLAPLAGAAAAFAIRGATADPYPAPDTAPAGAAPAGAPLLLRLAAPLALMLVAAVAASAFLTFIAIPLEHTPWVAAAALLGYAAAALATRWLAGHIGDRQGRPVLLAPGTAVSVLGAAIAAAAVWPAGPPAVAAALAVAGATLFGAGFGAVQNDTIVVMFRRGGRSGYGTASAAWNIGFDGGTGLGAVLLGLAISAAGYGPAFAATAAALALLIPTAAVLARRG